MVQCFERRAVSCSSNWLFDLLLVDVSQRLWVGPGSRAARDKAAFEASFGPFYRVAQIIISTTPTSNSTYISTTGLPSIVTDANIRLLFDMQYLVDSLKGASTLYV